MPEIWRMSAEETARTFGSDLVAGLTASGVDSQYRKYGPNRLIRKKKITPLSIFIEQFKSFIIWVLIVAAVVSGFLGELADALAIIAIVILNAILGFAQEYRAEKSLEALKKLSNPNSKVWRNGILQTVQSDDLVPGDLVLLEAGDFIPADGRIVGCSSNFQVQEAALTGESSPVRKSYGNIDIDRVALGERSNCLFMGTSVTAGKGTAILFATGMSTELGKIAGMLDDGAREPTPLQRKIAAFGRWLVYICIVLVAIVFVTGLLHGGKLIDMFLTAVSLAVAAIPEGLPAVVTIALAFGVKRMVRRNALIRKLPSVETLGGATVICSDKTGTLTRNEMTVQAIFAGEKLYEVTGTGYTPEGDILDEGTPVGKPVNDDIAALLEVCVLCNGAGLVEKNGVFTITGDPTEGALLTLGQKGGVSPTEAQVSRPLVHELPFDSSRKMMTMVRKEGESFIAYVKGAPDVLLRRCTHRVKDGKVVPMDDKFTEKVLHINMQLANRAMRILGFGQRVFGTLPAEISEEAMENDLIFTGLAAMIDPPREEARIAVRECRDAGIRAVMITGDHRDTAVAIARELGIYREGSGALTGEELDLLSGEEFDAVVGNTQVYARVSPTNKLNIVKALRAGGEVVAMTGDGVNDAPAIKEADIGVAMGITGTDVTKEVSDMIVTDDNFASIVDAVREGRGIYDNIRKFIHYLLSCNAGEILVMFIAALVGIPIPLLPIQILWMNLLTDGLPALALGIDPTDKEIMKRRPRPLAEPIITKRHGFLIIVQGFVIAFASLFAFWWFYFVKSNPESSLLLHALQSFDFHELSRILSIPRDNSDAILSKARTVGFMVLAFAQDFHSYNCRSQTTSLFKIGFFSNKNLVGATLVSLTLNLCAIYVPFFQHILKTTPLTIGEFIFVIAAASTPLWFMEVVKLVSTVRAAVLKAGS